MQIVNGMNDSGGTSVWGYTANSSNASDTLNTAYLGMISNNVLSKNLLLKTAGDVEIPSRLDAGTIYATTYLNLPTTPTPDLLPITLDKTNNRVGINILIPEEALDVDGNIQGTGDLVIDGNIYLKGIQSNPTSQSLFYDPTTKLVSYGTASTPTPDLLPITLNKTNNRVGINKTNPATALDVDGTTTTTNLTLTGIASATKSQILYYDTTTKQVSHGTISTPTPDLLPITLDKTNNRVGINKTNPNQALDVAGTVNSTAYYLSGSSCLACNNKCSTC